MPASTVNSCLQRFKQEFQTSKFSLNYDRPSKFYTSEWSRLNKWPFWIVRLLICIYFLASITISLSYSAIRGRIGFWLIYMTSINHLFVTLYAISCLVMVVMSTRQLRSGTAADVPGSNSTGSNMAFVKFTKVHWLLFNISSNICTFVVFAYWIMVFPTDKEFKNNVDPMMSYANIDRHGINLLLLLLDFSLSCTPVRLLHCIYPTCVMALFFIYNSIYWACTGGLVYGSVLDYGKNTGLAVAMVFLAVFIVTPVTQVIWFLMFLLRERLAIKKENELGSCYELANYSNNS